MKKTSPAGSWRSPLGSEHVVAAATRVAGVVVDGDDIYVAESRPKERGRTTVVRVGVDDAVDLLAPPYDVRSRVHEYGGGAFAMQSGTLLFVDFTDQRLYRMDPGGEPAALTPDDGTRHAAPGLDSKRNRIVVVTESGTGTDAENRLVSIDARGQSEAFVLASGRDFYASARLSPDATKLAWLEWDHPNMPWDGTELVVAELDEAGNVTRRQRIAGGSDISIFQPEWGDDGSLYFVSDEGGYWNPHVFDGARCRALLETDAEFGLPQWTFEMSTYAPLPNGRLACAYHRSGRWQLGLLDPKSGELTPCKLPYSEISSVRRVGSDVVFVGAGGLLPPRLVRLSVASGHVKELRRFSEVDVDEAYLSEPEPIEFPTTDGATAHALYYRPKNRDFELPPGQRAPLLVKSHGGPTGAASATLNMRTQYFTSRGIGVLDVDYRGSTGYGRAYRAALDGAWGIRDVDDCVKGAEFLVQRGDADANRLLITGGSAGGYTTLAALAFRDVFSAGASHYGVSDLEALARETHKFESRYLDRLVGPYPEAKATYRERSPIHHVDRLSCPVIFFQGLDDKVVPPNQAELMVQALREKGIPVAHVTFAGEGHGFRKAENIRRAIEAELSFYAQILGFEIADTVEPVTIEAAVDDARN